MKRPTQTNGFTLIELLVVMSIIGVLVSVVLVSVNQARVTSRNAQRIAIVSQYKVALELAYDASNAFPAIAPYSCLGAYTNNQCWANSFTSSSILDAAVAPFISGKPSPSTTGLVNSGLLYAAQGTNSYIFLWFLEGVNKNCDPGYIHDPNYASQGNTWCIYVR